MSDDRGSTSNVYELYAAQVYGWAYRFLGRHHDALDVVQDVFLKWMTQCARGTPDHPRGWLRRVTVNRAIDVVRQRRETPEAAVRVVDGVPAAAIAVVVVVSITGAGIVRIAAFLVMPAAAARVLTRTFAAMSVVSIVIGMSTVVVGLYVSYYADLPSGPAIILTQAAVLCAAVAIRR